MNRLTELRLELRYASDMGFPTQVSRRDLAALLDVAEDRCIEGDLDRCRFCGAAERYDQWQNIVPLHHASDCPIAPLLKEADHE